MDIAWEKTENFLLKGSILCVCIMAPMVSLCNSYLPQLGHFHYFEPHEFIEISAQIRGILYVKETIARPKDMLPPQFH